MIVAGAPAEGEGLPGYLTRLYEAQGYRFGRLKRTVRSRAGKLQPPDLPLLSIDSSPGAQIAEAFAAIRQVHSALPPSALTGAFPRVCPVCLADQEVRLAVWDFKANAACTRHRGALLDTCPNCGKRLKWYCDGVADCGRCRASLSSMDTSAAPSDALALSRLLEQREREDGGPLGVEGWMAASFFGIEPSEARWRSMLIAGHGVAEAIDRASVALSVLSDWPNGLWGWLDERRVEHEGGRVSLGPWAKRLRNAFARFEGSVVLAGVERYFAERWRGLPLKRTAYFGSSRFPTTLPVAAAAKTLVSSPAAVRAMIASGDLIGGVARMGKRTFGWVDARSLSERAAHNNNLLHPTAAAGRLGTSERQLRRLVRDGWIEPRRVARSDRFSAAALEGVLASLAPAPTAPDPVRCVTLSEVAASRSVSLAAVLAGIRDRSIACWRIDGEGFAGIAVAADSISGVGLSHGERTCSVRAAAAQLGVSPRAITAMVRRGCLASGTGASVSRRRAISLSSVTEFPRRFVMARELAARWQTSTRGVARRLSSAGLRPHVEGSTVAGISSVWLRRDVERFCAASETRN